MDGYVTSFTGDGARERRRGPKGMTGTSRPFREGTQVGRSTNGAIGSVMALFPQAFLRKNTSTDVYNILVRALRTIAPTVEIQTILTQG